MSSPSTNPQFCSEPLQSAVDSAKEVFENLEETRTRVSNDIKKLEVYLQERGLKEPFRFGLGKAFCIPEGREGSDIEFALRECGSAGGHVTEEAIVWGPHGDDRHRLLYEFSKWEGGVEVDLGSSPLYWDEATLARESKPLIEAKFDIRKRMYPRLPDFIHALREHLSVEEPKASKTIDPDDIPF